MIPSRTAAAFAFTVVSAVFCVGRGHAQTDQTPTGYVYGGDGRPLSGVTLRFRDAEGRAVALKTGTYGTFRADLERLSHDPGDGFVQTVRSFSTGGPTSYFFAPLGVREAIVHDNRGQPVRGLRVAFVRNRQAIPRITDRTGKASVSKFPLVASRCIGGEPLLSVVRVNDPRYAVASVREQASPRAVRYLVGVVRTGTLAGSLTVPGRKPGGWDVFATGKRGTGEILYHSTVVNRAGRFRIVGLLPGRYYVGARPRGGGRSHLPARPVRVRGGQTEYIALRVK